MNDKTSLAGAEPVFFRGNYIGVPVCRCTTA